MNLFETDLTQCHFAPHTSFISLSYYFPYYYLLALFSHPSTTISFSPSLRAGTVAEPY